MELFRAVLIGLAVGGVLTWLALRSRYAAALAAASAERDLLRERVVDLETLVSSGAETAQLVAPLDESLRRVEAQVRALEKERDQQFAQVSAELAMVQSSTHDLRTQTASLVGSLNASTVRGSWGEVQLRRVLEHAGLLAKCDFEEQVAGRNLEGASVRPDVVLRLPGGRHLVIDAKAPMTAFLTAQGEGLTAQQRDDRLRAHARALRGHVDTLAGKAYWSALPSCPEMVVCFVPGEAFLSAALTTDPDLHEHAMRRKVVLTSPGSLLALLRTVAFTWRQDALTEGARELLALGRDLHARLGGLGSHASRMGAALQRTVEAYNGLVGSLESRVLVTARRMNELDLATDVIPEIQPVTTAPRPLTALELIEALEPEVARPEVAEMAAEARPAAEASA